MRSDPVQGIATFRPMHIAVKYYSKGMALGLMGLSVRAAPSV